MSKGDGGNAGSWFEIVGADPGPWLTIHLTDVDGLVRKQGGAIAAFVNKGAPRAIEKAVYTKLKDKLTTALADEGVSAEVQIVANPPASGKLTTDFATGALVGAGTTGLLYLLFNLLFRR